MYLSHARLASWRMTIRSPWPNVAYGTHKRSSRNRKSGSLAFTLPGASTFDAVEVLSAFEFNLRLFTEHRDALLSVKRRRQ